MDRQSQRYNLLDEIDTEKDDWNIRVRVTRMWEVLNIKTNNELMSVDLVLHDEKDNLIHASIRKSFVNRFRDIQEDVIGEMVGISLMEKIEVCGKKLNKRLIELQDNRREKIRITFWDKFAEAINEDICFDNFVRPIIIITSTTVKTYMRKLSLSSTNSSKLYVNLDIPEVIELRKSLEETEFSLDEKEKKIESLQLPRSILDPNEISKMKRTLLEILTFIKTEKEQVSIECARYRLDMQVGDTTEHANFVVFDKEAENLIKVSAMQLSNMEEEETTKRGANNGNEVLEEKICAQVKKRKILKK
uniref:Replication protein A 70 kDa DNA-binding subunit B/D first OB fold domain-containing protein n=1 Tax=Quercus lobata TaxID=97700 RepID=A0A7N2N963_QUELO